MNDIVTTEVSEVITAEQINQQALHSMQVMEQWGDGEVYNEAVWVEKGKQAINKTLEGMFELGKALIVLKEHTEHGRFLEIAEKEFGIKRAEVARLINATMRFGSKEMKQVQAKFSEKGIGKSKILELLVEDDDNLIELANGGDINGNTLDDVDRMTIKELRLALREAREDKQAKDEVISQKSAKIDELAEKLAKQKVKEPRPGDVARELSAQLASTEVAARSEISKLKDIFDGFAAHTLAHGSDHTALMVGAINQLILDCERLRNKYDLPADAPTDTVPAWLQEMDGEMAEPADDDNLSFDFQNA
ncbi:hypothetical protein [Moraxella catarrhalis]|uniref:hypothetical protein n=1 Tax=Moraxella catarrhalis TaxID=480 RepID=UPI00128E0DFE|nr:hypothetical protein [Moraxella catarrhalis]MPY07390.1 hypothetical protein [Moraxella catarrhalis]